MAVSQGMRTLLQEGLALVADDVTTISESHPSHLRNLKDGPACRSTSTSH